MTETSDYHVQINSLVTLNISDHWTRTLVRTGQFQRVCGALLGKQFGRSIVILNTFEVLTLELDGFTVIDEEYFVSRQTLFKETFPTLEFVGFYITCDDHKSADKYDIAIQKQAMTFNESPFLLKFNTLQPIVGDNKLAISIFECVFDPTDELNIIFHNIPIKIHTELAEQIGLDHVARLSKNGNNFESTASKYLLSQFGAIQTLQQGIIVIRNYVKAVKDEKVEKDLTILKDINKLCQKLTALKSQDVAEKEAKRFSDQKLMILLSSIASIESGISNVITKINLLSSDRTYPSFMSSSGGIMHSKKFFQRV